MFQSGARVLAITLLLPWSSLAQQNATVQGSVVDESRAVLPGASVTAVDTSTGRETVAVTAADGRFRFDSLPPGTYQIRFELPGFAVVQIPKLELLVGTNATVPPVVLKVAGLEESILVTSEAPLVDITSSQVAGNIDRRQMAELPLQGRNWQELSLLVKGITVNNVDQRPGVARDDQFQLNLDGQQITQRVAGSGFGQPKISREAIAEFQIVTNLFDITQGRSTGIQVQAVSRSGTNDFRGSTYGFFRSDRFNEADPVAGRRAAVLEPAGGRHAGRADPAQPRPLLRLLRIRARAVVGVPAAAAPAQPGVHVRDQVDQQELPRPLRPAPVERRQPHRPRPAVGLQQPVPDHERHQPSVARRAAHASTRPTSSPAGRTWPATAW